MSGDKTKTLTLAGAFQEGVALQRRGEMAAAARIYREIVKVKPDFAEAHHNLGAALKALGHPARAAESYRRALAARPDYDEARNNLARTLRALDRDEEAVECYRETVASINPHGPPPTMTTDDFSFRSIHPPGGAVPLPGRQSRHIDR